MENSAQKAGFAIAAMIAVVVAVGIGVDWWDAYDIRKAANGGALIDPAAEASAEKRLTEEVERLKMENLTLKIDIDELRRQLQAAEKKELEPLRKEPEALKPEGVPVKTIPPGDGPISEN